MRLRILVSLAALLVAPGARAQNPNVVSPRTLDPELEIALVAAEPELVTPVGVAVDSLGRVLVVESHTHFRPEGYQGPPADRVLQFEDRDGDGTFESRSVVFEGTKSTMSVAVEPDDSLLLATRREILRLARDASGRATNSTRLAHLETAGDYPHNGLSGFALDLDGSITFGMGENLGASYTLEGADGKKHAGGGEGGNVFRIAHDGGGLTRVATGFWNPFHVAFDPFGRLFAVDNDPDSRPPCRLLHVVERGDYGYRFRNGRRGLHPFTAWNGELPGTLPMAAGTGEAPSGLLVYESDGLPESYRGRILVTSWGDHQIEAYTLEPSGASITAARVVIIQGNEQFRPVGIAQAPDGSVFVSDWVDRSYAVHRKGRLWRIRQRAPIGPRSLPASDEERLTHADLRVREQAARSLAQTEAGRRALRHSLDDPHANPRTQALALRILLAAEPHAAGETIRLGLASADTLVRAIAARHLATGDREARRLAGPMVEPAVRAAALRLLNDSAALGEIRDAARIPDPFLRLAARIGLEQSASVEQRIELTRDDDPAVRLQALLSLREVAPQLAGRVLPSLLREADPQIRLAALEWVAEAPAPELATAVRAGIAAGPLTDRLFGAYLLALARLQGTEAALEAERPDPRLCARLAFDPALPAAFRAMALRWVDPQSTELTDQRIEPLVTADDPVVRIAAVRLLAGRGQDRDHNRLARLAADAEQPAAIRAEAAATLDPARPADRRLLTQLAATAEPIVRRQAARSLRGVELAPDERAALARGGVLEITERSASATDLTPATLAQHADRPGDPEEGERVFFHPRGPKCAECHQVAGRGARIGPDLVGLGETASEERLLQSILEPSREIAPQFTVWRVDRRDGTSVEGLLEADRDDVQVYRQADGKTVEVPTREVEARSPLTTSLMPRDLSRLMTAQELRDLIAYLKAAGTLSEADSGRSRNTP